MSWTANPWCAPSGFQGHAVWHVLSGLGAFFLYLYFRSEGEPRSITVGQLVLRNADHGARSIRSRKGCAPEPAGG